MIKLTEVHKQYKKGGPVLSGVDLLVHDGEFLFITGPSGSGKSTVLKLLTGETEPTSGRVSVNGYDMESLRPWQIPYVRRTLGVVFQDYRLIADRTVRENVELAVRAVNGSLAGLSGRVEYAAELAGIANKLDDQARTLSGGEKQRAAIARAVVNHPQAVLADEPTGNLDPATSEGIMELLYAVNGLGITTLVVTHDRDAVMASGRRAVAIEKGRVVHDGAGYYLSEWDRYKLRTLDRDRQAGTE